MKIASLFEDASENVTNAVAEILPVVAQSRQYLDCMPEIVKGYCIHGEYSEREENQIKELLYASWAVYRLGYRHGIKSCKPEEEQPLPFEYDLPEEDEQLPWNMPCKKKVQPPFEPPEEATRRARQIYGDD